MNSKRYFLKKYHFTIVTNIPDITILQTTFSVSRFGRRNSGLRSKQDTVPYGTANNIVTLVGFQNLCCNNTHVHEGYQQ